MYLTWLTSLFWIGLTLAHSESNNVPTRIYGPQGIAISACAGVISQQATYCADYPTMYMCGCENSAYLATLAGCLEYYNEFNVGALAKLQSSCKMMNMQVTELQMVAALNTFRSSAVTPSEIDGFDISKTFNAPIKLNTTLLDIYRRSYYNYYGNFDRSIYWGSGLLAYWLLVLTIATISHWTKRLDPALVKSLTGPVSTFWRRHISLPALIRRRRNREVKCFWLFDFLVPTRLELLILLGFLVLTGILCGIGLHTSQPDPKFPKRVLAVCRLVADRTGILATSFTPLIVLFAGRNNFLQWLTGWSFSRFITFHRWTGRLSFTLVFIHAIAFTVRLSIRKIYVAEAAKDYFIYGIVGTVGGGVLMFQGLLRLRRKWYEMFLLVHIAMAGVYIGGSWMHVTTLGYVWYFYAALAVWIFDRLVRIARLAYFGCPEATVSLVADETMRVVAPRPKYWKLVPGGHAFIHFMRPSCFWQSHPFTFTVDNANDCNIVMYLKIKGGVTHGLHQQLLEAPNHTLKIRVAVEGPYGSPSMASRSDCAVFVAGGNGIPGIYSEALDCSRKLTPQSARRVRLYWIVRELKDLNWFRNELLALKDSRVETMVVVTKQTVGQDMSFANSLTEKITDDVKYDLPAKTAEVSEITSPQRNTDESLSDADKFDKISLETRDETLSSQASTLDLSHITFMYGRQSMDGLVQREIEQSPGSIAFVTCGHPNMVDDLRYAVVNQLDTTKKRMEFFEQLQVWA